MPQEVIRNKQKIEKITRTKLYEGRIFFILHMLTIKVATAKCQITI